MRILVVEDEARVLRFLEESLRHEGHLVSACRRLSEAKDLVASSVEPFEAILLDRMIHGEDSITLLPLVREHQPLAKILVLSALNSVDEKARALDAGADDYLSKPFSLVELTARLRALGRRSSPDPRTAKLELGGLSLDPLAHVVEVAGRRIDLSQKEYLLLQTLLQRPGQVYNRFQLLDRVWNSQFDIESNVVEVTVRNLRRKLESEPCRVVISSRRNVGYWIEGT